MHIKSIIPSALLLLAPPALAIPFHSERGHGGALAGPAWSSGASIGLNPAAMPLDRPTLLVEGSLQLNHLSVLATRNDGYDPNTNAPYPEAVSESWTRGGFAGLTWPLLDNRVVLGLAYQVPSPIHLDFRDDPEEPCLDISTRYAAILYEKSSLELLPALSVRVIDGIHLGASMTFAQEQVRMIQAWDPMGTEGMGPGEEQPGFYVPYSNDVLVRAEMEGSHLEWTGGIWVQRIPFVQIGASYTHRKPMAVSGGGLAEFSVFMGGIDVPAQVTLNLALADELRVGITTQPELPVQASVTWGMEIWESCCGDREGDASLEVLHEDGEPIGPAHGVIVEVSDEFYLPRRMENSTNLRVGIEYSIFPIWSLGLHGGLQSHSVPDFAMNALQQDFDTREGGLHSAIQIGERLRLGASYTHRMSSPRIITNSAWDVHIISADDIPENYVDERFSPQLPFTASGNGEYAHHAKMMAMRLELQL